ncbi:MAG: GNAT family N-acetyltransferase [Eubacterium sp.]|nr:GNAT family N-acetyltransferase [Eubacterium sp.]
MNQLIEWSPAWENAVQEYKNEFLAAGMDWEGIGGSGEPGKETEPGKYVSSTYLYVDGEEDRIIGLVNLRQGQDAESLAQIGNIGFSIRPSEQKKGCAVRMLQEAAALSVMQGIVPWYMVCLASNTASKKVITRLGGRKQGEITGEEGCPVRERYVVYDVF